MLDDFWNAALSEDKVSARFMRDSDATVETVDGRDIVVIRVPWVDRYTRPVYIDNNIFGGTFRRTHTGDHQCKREEVLSMLRDNGPSRTAEIAEGIGMGTSQANVMLRVLTGLGLVTVSGATSARHYRLAE